MKNLLILPAEVIQIAFPSSENIREDLVTDIQIETAQIKYLKPVLGPLYQVLDGATYTDFVASHLKKPLAFFVRALVVEELGSSVSMMGVMQNKNEFSMPVSMREQAMLRKKARSTARFFLQEALRHIEANAELFPEYDPRQNILNRCSLLGGIAL